MAKKKQVKEKPKTLIEKIKERINFKNSNIPWIIYGLAFGPLELAIIYFGVNTDGASGLFKLIGAMIVISFLFTFIPQMIRIFLKFFRKDFYGEDAMAAANISASSSVVITWLIGLIFFSDLNGGKVGLVITIVVLMIGIMGCNIPAIWSIYKLLYLGDDYPSDNYSSSSSSKDYSNKKESYSFDSLFGEDEKKNDIKIGKMRGDGRGFFYNKDGSLGGTSITDNHGTTFFRDSNGAFGGTSITDSNGVTYYKDSSGNVTGTSVKDSNGRTYYRDKDGKVVGTSIKDSNETTYFDDTKW